MQHVRLGMPKREHKDRKTRPLFSLFIWNYEIKIKCQRFREFNKLFSDIGYSVTSRNNTDMLH